MKQHHSKLLAVATVAALLTSCGATDSSSGGITNASFSLKMVQGNGSAGLAKHNRTTALTLTEAGITVNEAAAFVRRVDLYLPENHHCSDVQQLFGDDDCHRSDDDHSSHHHSSGHSKVATRGGDDDGFDDHSDDSDHDEDHLRFEGPFVVDLLTGTATPSWDSIQIPAGTYRRVKIKFDDAREGQVPAGSDLLDHTLVARGTFVDSSEVTHPFLLKLRFNESINFRSRSGVVIAEGDTNPFAMQFDVDRWFAGVDLRGCLDRGELEYQPDGTLLIDDRTHGEGDCKDIEKTIRRNLKGSCSARHGDDDDHDDDHGHHQGNHS